MGRVRRGKQKHAAKKNSRKNLVAILIFVCIAIAVIVGAIIIFGSSQQQGDVRVFTSGSQRVSLYDNGVFSAQLAHSVAKNGTYNESAVGDVTTVIFTYDGKTEEGNIIGNVLTFLVSGMMVMVMAQNLP